ncbi:MAG: DoxX family protein [Myxococcales bacterium]|nr:DoxX family protein [Myxococcales bacterium]
MRVALWINRVLLTLLSISTGAVKIYRMEEEMFIFREAGFPDVATIAFGVVQLGLGLALIPAFTTHAAAWGMAVTFVLATGVLFVNGMIPFGMFSLLFIASAVVHARLWPTADT